MNITALEKVEARLDEKRRKENDPKQRVRIAQAQLDIIRAALNHQRVDQQSPD